MTAGLSSASFCRIASALRYSASASAGLPVFNSRPEVVVAVRQAAAEFGHGGVVVDKLLLHRQRLAVLGLRLRRLAVSTANSRGCCGCRQLLRNR